MTSFLYFFGVLNIDHIDAQGKLLLKVPNLVMQGLYVERVQRMLLPAVKADLSEGKQQALDYGQVLVSRHPQLRLKRFVVLAVGFERGCFVNADEFE